MKESAAVGLVTIGLLVVLVAVVAGGVEDAGLISMARHFPLTAADLGRATELAQSYQRCQLDYIQRNRTQYPAASVLAESSGSVCAAQLLAASNFLRSQGYAGDVVAREIGAIKDTGDRAMEKRIAALY